jgi:vacuolar-type H+-ATPase subunit F/Vma7
MGAPTFLGDELTSAGFRLAGMRVVDAVPDRLEADFLEAVAVAPLVIITASVAGRLPAQLLDRALRRARPPVAIVPEVVGETPMPDLEREVRIALGVES